jgi:transitional endoplasmic reticulum ATPase
MHAYEAAMLGRYARNLFMPNKYSRWSGRGDRAIEALFWLSRNRILLAVPNRVFEEAAGWGSDKSAVDDLSFDDWLARCNESSEADAMAEDSTPWSGPVARSTIRKWAKALVPALPTHLSPLQRRIEQITQTLGLSPGEGAVIGLLMRIKADSRFQELMQGVFDGEWSTVCDPDDGSDLRWDQVAAVLKLNKSTLDHLTRSDSKVRTLGLVSQCRRDAELADPLLQIAQSRHSNKGESIIQTLMGRKCRPSETVTKWDDFAYLGSIREVALALIQGALAGQERGVVILLHGPPGTGKTAFAQTLIRHAGAKGWMVGEEADDGDEAKRRDRLSSLLLASALSEASKDAVLVLDEADDVFNDGASGFMSLFAPSKARDGSKIFMNRALENLKAPTILIVNDANNLGDAIVRRASLAIEIKTPSVELSAKIATRVLARQKLKVSAQTISDLAQSGTPVAVMALAARTAALTGGGASHVKLAARSVTRMLDIEKKSLVSDLAGMGFDPAFANADCDLAALADAAVSCGTRALSFCLYGLPGTGKSAFARWIAGRMGLEVVEKRASDLLSKWVGGSEKNIARAFEEAADRQAFLIFDEADSLLSDRTNATKSWEVSQVNEMLTWMERHPLPFAATTNLMAGLDPAALRRFLFKAEFKPMLPSQAKALFERTFGCEAPAAIGGLDLLTPGDFAVVARKARVLNQRDPKLLLAALQGEVALKPGASRVRVGF